MSKFLTAVEFALICKQVIKTGTPVEPSFDKQDNLYPRFSRVGKPGAYRVAVAWNYKITFRGRTCRPELKFWEPKLGKFSSREEALAVYDALHSRVVAWGSKDQSSPEHPLHGWFVANYGNGGGNGGGETVVTVRQAVEAFTGQTTVSADGRALRANSTEQRVEACKRIVERLGDRPVKDVTRAEIVAFLEWLATAPVYWGGKRGRVVRPGAKLSPASRKHVRRALEAVFDLARKHKHIAASPCVDLDDEDNLKLGKVAARERVLVWSELRSLGAYLQTAANVTDMALRAVLLMPGRKMEIVTVDCRDVRDLDRDDEAHIVFGAGVMKGRREQHVPLVGELLALVRARFAAVGGKGPLFPSPADRCKGQPLSEHALNNRIKALTKAGKIDNADVATWGCWTPHDLRRSFISLMSDHYKLRYDAAVERVVAHKKSDVTNAVYRHGQMLETKREALIAWEELLRRKDVLPARQGTVVAFPVAKAA